MPTLTSSFEGGSDGTTITTANSGGISGDAFDSVNGAPTFASSAAANGNLGMSSPLAATSALAVNWAASFGTGFSSQFWGRDYFTITSLPPAVIRLSQGNGSGAARWGIAVDTTGKVGVRNLSSGTFAVLSATILTLGVKNRYEFSAAFSGSAWTVTLQLFYGANYNGTVPDEIVTSPAMTLGAIDTYQFGALATGSVTWSGVAHDDLGLSDAGALGSAFPVPPPPPPSQPGSTQWQRRYHRRQTPPPPPPSGLLPGGGTSARFGITTPSTTASVPSVAGCLAGDLLLIWVAGRAASLTFSITAGSSGWTAVTASTGQNFSCQLFYKTADSTDAALAASGGAYTVTCSASQVFGGFLADLPGYSFDPSAPASSGQVLASGGTSYTVTGVTTAGNGDLLLLFAGDRWAGGGTVPAMGFPGGWATAWPEVDYTNAGISSSAGAGFALGYRVQAAAGATGSPVVSLSASANGGGLLLALSPASSTPPGVAVLSGTGSVSTGAVQGTTGTALSGTGSVAAAPTVPPGAALAGAGQLTALPPLSLRSAQAVATSAGASTLAVPAQPVAAGDLIFIWVSTGFATISFTAASGDGLTAETANTPAGMSTQLFWRIATSADVTKAAAGGSYVITQTGASHPFAAVIGTVPVTSTAHPYDPSDTPGSGQTNAASNAVTAAGITIGTAGDLLIWLGAVKNATVGGAPAAITVPSGFTVPSGVAQASSAAPLSVNTGILLATETQVTAGATGSQAGSFTGTTQITGGLLLAVRAAPVSPIPGVVTQIVAGAPASSSVQVVAKTAGATSCRLAYSTSSSMTSPSYVSAQVPDSLGYVRYTATGLSSHTRYYFQLADTPPGGTETLIGPVGACKTLPPAGSPQNFTAAFVSCIAGGDTTTPPAIDAAITDWVGYDADLNIFTGDLDYSGTTSTSTATQVGVYESQIATVPSLASMISTRWGFYCRSDHEAGPDNGDSNNAYTATNIAAAQQVFPFGTLGDTVNTPVHGLYQAWVVGRIRFIMIDIRNTDRSPGGNTDNSSKTMLGTTQLAWLENQLIQSEPLKIIISDVAWMGPASITSGPDKWWSYDTERQAIISYIAANAHQVQNLMLWHGDSHLIGYATAAANTWGGFPVWCAAPMLNTGGGLNTGTFTSFYNNSGGECRLYGRVSFTDNGSSITAAFQGWDAAAGVAQVSRTETFPTPTADLGGTGSLNASGGIAGAAALGGSGSISTAATQGTTGTVLGAQGSVSPPATQGAPTSLGGQGSLITAETIRAPATLAGTGSLATAETLLAPATLAAAGSLAATATQGAPTSLSGAGSLSTAAATIAPATLAGAGSLSATAGAGGTLGGAGSLNAPGTLAAPATLTATGSLTMAVTQGASASLAGTGSLAGTVIQRVISTLAGTGSLTTSAPSQGGQLGGAGSLNAPGSATLPPAVLAGAGSLAGTVIQSITTTLAGTGSLAAAVTQRAAAVLAGTGSLAGSGASRAPQVKGGSTGWSVTNPYGSVPVRGELAGTSASVTQPARSSPGVS